MSDPTYDVTDWRDRMGPDRSLLQSAQEPEKAPNG